MASHTTRIRLEKQADGENPNSWGLVLNQNVIDLVDEAVAGYTVVSVSSVGVSLTSNNGSSDQSRNLGLRLEGALTAEVTVAIPANEKIYFVYNDTTGSHNVLIKPTGGTAVTATSQGQAMLIATNGSTIDKFDSGFESGTKMLFQQTNAPAGWTKDTTNNDDSAIRITTGTVGTGGNTAFTTAFVTVTTSATIVNSISGNVGNTTLSIAQIPAHTHYNDFSGGFNGITGSGGSPGYISSTQGRQSGSTGGGQSHNHSAGSLAVSSTFTGNSTNLDVKYVDVIVATKD